jgi:hypothetical protein
MNAPRCVIAAPPPSGECPGAPASPLGLCLRHLAEAADGRAEMACFATKAEAEAWIEKNRPAPGPPRQVLFFGNGPAHE